MDDLAFPWVISCSQLGSGVCYLGAYREHVRGAFLACERCRRRRYADLIARLSQVVLLPCHAPAENSELSTIEASHVAGSRSSLVVRDVCT